MPSKNDDLHQLLVHLHEQLSRASNIDAATAEELGVVMEDIRAALARRDAADHDDNEKPAAQQHHATLADAAREFSAEHPLLARTINQLADILGQSGI